MPGRSFSQSNAYRFGFNGKENDSEIKGEGNQQDYGMRIYDPRLGRFLSVDPISREYPWYTPYQFGGNTPIQAIDLDGLEPYKRTASSWNEFRTKLLNRKISLVREQLGLDHLQYGNQEIARAKNSFGLSSLALMKSYYDANTSARNASAPKGTQFSNQFCQYDCITSLGEGMKILLGYNIPVVGNASKYINENLKGVTTGNKISFDAKYATDNVKDKTVSGFTIDIGQAMLKETGNVEGVHFFVSSLAGDDHALMFAVSINSKGGATYFKMDNINKGFQQLGDKGRLDGWIKSFYESNGATGTEDTNGVKDRLWTNGFMKRIDPSAATAEPQKDFEIK